MSLIVIRDAREDDSATIDEHRRQSQEEGARFRGSTQENRRTFSVGFSLVALVDQEIVGSCSCSYDDDVAFVSHIFVEPDARGIGVGDSLLRELLAKARTTSSRVLAHALPGDRDLKNLFERQGMTAQTIIVGRSLTD